MIIGIRLRRISGLLVQMSGDGDSLQHAATEDSSHLQTFRERHIEVPTQADGHRPHDQFEDESRAFDSKPSYVLVDN